MKNRFPSISRGAASFMLAMSLTTAATAQQSAPASAIANASGNFRAKEDEKFKRFAAFGVGDVNTQSLAQINASGKLSAFIVPYYKEDKKFMVSTFLSFNVNATNKDTLIQGTILFPALGNASFLGTLDLGWLNRERKAEEGNTYLGFFGEFAAKRISIKNDDTSVYFNVNNITVGFKSTFYYKHSDDDPLISLTGQIYYNMSHIPDKDKRDFRYILDQQRLDNTFHSVGAKISLGVNNLQFFADMRHTMYQDKTVPDRELASFNSNVGVILPIEIKIGK